MCFSATASFSASIILTAISILAIKQATRRSTLLLACSPLIFACQQASEGFLWLALTHPSWQWIQMPAMYFFLFCALCWWPFWIPFVLTILEKNNLAPRKILINLLAFGTLFSLYMLFCLIVYGAQAAAPCCHIAYTLQIPGEAPSFLGILYLIPAVLPFFISTIPGMYSLGISITLAYAISYLFYRLYFLSVWCFFAAILSIIILFIVKRIESSR